MASAHFSMAIFAHLVEKLLTGVGRVVERGFDYCVGQIIANYINEMLLYISLVSVR